MTGKKDCAGLFIQARTELEHQRKRDRTLSRAIDEIGKIESLVTPHPFIALMLTIVAQQISSGAAGTVGGALPGDHRRRVLTGTPAVRPGRPKD